MTATMAAEKNEMVDDRKAQIKGFVGPRFDNKRWRHGEEDVLKGKIIKTWSNTFLNMAQSLYF